MKLAGREITKYAIALFAIVLIGAFLRVYHLATQSLSGDEAFSFWISTLSLPQTVHYAATIDVHPPLYYFILHYWMLLFGTSAFAMRLLSALFGVLAIPMIYVVGRQLFNKEVGLLGALILAVSSFNVLYSQDARMYSLMVFLGLLSTYFFLRFLQQSNNRVAAAYILSTTLLLYTHVYGWFVVIAQNIWVVALLLSRNRTLRPRSWVALQVIIVLLFVPWIGIFVSQISTVQRAPWIQMPTLTTLTQTFTLYSGTELLLILFFGLSLLSLFTYTKKNASVDWKAPLKALKSYSLVARTPDVRSVLFLALLIFTLNAVPFAMSRFYASIYGDRYTIAASVALYLLVAAGIRNISHNYAKFAVIAVIVLLSAVPLQAYYTTTAPQAREAVNFVDQNLRSGDLVLLSPGDHWPVIRYYNHKAMNLTLLGNTVSSTADRMKILYSATNGHSRVWLVVANVSYSPTEQILKALNGSYEITLFKSYVGYQVYLFENRSVNSSAGVVNESSSGSADRPAIR